jgi:molecular chaperone GrpE
MPGGKPGDAPSKAIEIIKKHCNWPSTILKNPRSEHMTENFSHSEKNGPESTSGASLASNTNDMENHTENRAQHDLRNERETSDDVVSHDINSEEINECEGPGDQRSRGDGDENNLEDSVMEKMRSAEDEQLSGSDMGGCPEERAIIRPEGAEEKSFEENKRKVPEDAISDGDVTGNGVKAEVAAEDIEDDMADNIKRVLLMQEQLVNEFQTKLKYDRYKEKIIDNLHRELQEHKNNIRKKLLQPLIMDIILVWDDMNKMLEFYGNKESHELDPKKLLKLLEGFKSDLEEVLYRQQVEPFSLGEGVFDPVRQKVGQKIKTNEPALHKKVERTIRAGFEWDGDIIRPEIVAVNAFEEQGADK